MKTRFLPLSSLFLTILTFFAVLSAQAQVPSYVPTNGLVGYWPFNGNANDESGNGYNGTVVGAQLTSDRYGNTNSSYEFLGQTQAGSDNTVVLVDHVIDIFGFNPNLTNQISIALWSYTYDSSTGAFLQRRVNNSIDFACGAEGIHLGSVGVCSSINSTTNNAWHHHIYTYDGNIIEHYVDGILDLSIAGSGNIANNTSTMNFGKYIYYGGNTHHFFYNGILDDIGIWDRALTQEEVLNLYNSCIPSLYYSDIDGDGFGAGDALNTCNPPVGYVLNNTDCNDDNANQNEGVSEVCNNQDDNCNSSIDEGLTFQNYYLDSDGDGFGTGAANSSCIDLGVGYVVNYTDCDDSNASVNPNAEEIGANGIDENCDGQIDNSVEEFSTVISLFPNPATTELNLQITSDLIGTDVFVFDALGKQIHKQQILSTNININTSSFAVGNYVVKVGGVVKRFEVKR